MKAAILHAYNEDLAIEEVSLGRPGPHDVLIRTAFAGLCHSDLSLMQHAYPHPLPCALGHESSGVVEAVGSEVRYVAQGDHVVTCLSVFCGHCAQCLGGQPAMCDSPEPNLAPGVSRRLSLRGEVLHQYYNLSSFAEQMLVHEHAVVKIRPDMPLDLAALLGCAVLTGTGAVFRTAQVTPGSSVAVIGCGGVGLAAVNGAALAGAARIVAIDTQPDKLALARRMGATDTIDASAAGDVVEAVRSLTGGGVDHAFECLGSKATAEQAFNMLDLRGAATIVGVIPVGVQLALDGISFLTERRIQGSRMGSNRFRIDIPRLIEFYLQGRLHLDHMISHRLHLAQINEGFARMRDGTAVRQVIAFA